MTTATKQAQRTPGPWHTNVAGTRVEGPQYQRIANGHWYKTATMRPVAEANEENCANLRFIVTACNAYDAHVARIAELEAALQSLTDELFRERGFRTAELSKVGRAARAALAKVSP
jgi:hypothetical protein